MTTANDNPDSLFLPDGELRPELLGEAVPAALRDAVRQAEETNWDSIRTPHIFMGLLAVPDAGVRNWADRVGINLPELLGQFRDLFHQEHGQHPIAGFRRPFLSEEVVHLLAAANARAASRGQPSLTPMDLLVAMFTTKTIIAEIFERVGAPAKRLVDLAVLAEEESGQRPG